MKTPIYMIFAYLFLIVVGTALGAVIFTVYQTCTMIVSGSPLPFFSLSFFLLGLLEAFPVCVMLTAIFVPLYAVRHPEAEIVPAFAVYLALSFLSWGLLLPLHAAFAEKNVPSISAMQKKHFDLPSAGYFRQEGDAVLYLAAVESAENATDGTKRAFADGVEIRILVAEPKCFFIAKFWRKERRTVLPIQRFRKRLKCRLLCGLSFTL